MSLPIIKMRCGKGALLLASLAVLLASPAAIGSALAAGCPPTPWDEIGPFYRPDAPVRNILGKGYLLTGTVRSSLDCSPIPKARIEVWHTGPGGKYDDVYRATLFADRQGRYRLETIRPPAYSGRPSHIHLLVDALGFEGLITQHYPAPGARQAAFDLVLVPEASAEPKTGGRIGDMVRPGRKQK